MSRVPLEMAAGLLQDNLGCGGSKHKSSLEMIPKCPISKLKGLSNVHKVCILTLLFTVTYSVCRYMCTDKVSITKTNYTYGYL